VSSGVGSTNIGPVVGVAAGVGDSIDGSGVGITTFTFSGGRFASDDERLDSQSIIP
jgi:hypothetical protein